MKGYTYSKKNPSFQTRWASSLGRKTSYAERLASEAVSMVQPYSANGGRKPFADARLTSSRTAALKKLHKLQERAS